MKIAKKLLSLYLLAGLILATVLVNLYFFSLKDTLHTDEVMSYARANNSEQSFLIDGVDMTMPLNAVADGKLFNKTFRIDDYKHFVSATEDNRFSYSHIFEKLKPAEHPPFYFFVLHTICSFFPDTFSWWFAYSINLVALVLTLILFYKLAVLLLKDEYLALLAVGLWGFSNIGISTVIFLRMYALQTLFFVGLCYQAVIIYNKKDKAKRDDFLKLLFFSFMGMFTQYNSVVLAFVLTALGGLVFLKAKKYEVLKRYLLTMFLSALLLVLVYPYVLETFTETARGREITDKAFNLFSFSLENNLLFKVEKVLMQFVNILFMEFLPFNRNLFMPFYNFIAVSLWAVFYYKNKKTWFRILALAMWGVGCFLPLMSIAVLLCFASKNTLVNVFAALVVISVVTIGVVMPPMGRFLSRYFFALMPICSILFVRFLVSAFKHYQYKFIMLILASLMVFNFVKGNFYNRSAYQLKFTQTVQDFRQEIQGKKVLIVYFDNILNVYFSILPVIDTASEFMAVRNLNMLFKNLDKFDGMYVITGSWRGYGIHHKNFKDLGDFKLNELWDSHLYKIDMSK